MRNVHMAMILYNVPVHVFNSTQLCKIGAIINAASLSMSTVASDSVVGLQTVVRSAKTVIKTCEQTLV
jgi:hypothetical protein